MYCWQTYMVLFNKVFFKFVVSIKPPKNLLQMITNLNNTLLNNKYKFVNNTFCLFVVYFSICLGIISGNCVEGMKDEERGVALAGSWWWLYTSTSSQFVSYTSNLMLYFLFLCVKILTLSRNWLLWLLQHTWL